MDKINSLLDDQDSSLDEVLLLIDSYDFELATTNSEQDHPIDSTDFFNSIDTEDSLALTRDHESPAPCSNGDDKHHQSPTLSTVAPTNQSKGSTNRLPGTQVRGALSSEGPYKEHGRVRDRVIRLRAMAKQLEQQLKGLNGFKCHGPADGTSNGNEENQTSAENASLTKTKVSAEVVTWQQLATRQFAARQKAEKENLRLRERLEDQLRVAKRLERLIRGQLPEQTHD